MGCADRQLAGYDEVSDGPAFDRLDMHLETWALWMRSEQPARGYPRKSCGFVGGGYNTDFDSMCEAADVRVAQIVNALVDGLEPIQRMALHRRYLRAVYRFKDYPERLLEARERVRIGLRKRGVWLGE